jgi:molybdopterin biosynthesis enzyme
MAEVAVRVPRIGWMGEDPLRPIFAALVAAEGVEWSNGDPDLVLLAGDPEALGPGALILHGLGARPGMAAGVGLLGSTPVLLLSGRAEEALAAWYLLGRPALRHLAGAAPPVPIQARLARKLASTIGLLEIVPVRLIAPDLAEPLAIGALPAGLLAAADALLLVPPGVEGYEAGNAVALQPL